MREFSHRINNEFTSAINVIALTAARSDSSEVKAALNAVSERLYLYGVFRCQNTTRAFMRSRIFGSCAFPSVVRNWSRTESLNKVLDLRAWPKKN